MKVLTAALFAAWMALGVGAKALRYAQEREPAGPRAERLVREFLSARGWRLVGRRPVTTAGLYMAQSFEMSGCPIKLDVAPLGASGEAVDLLIENLGPDVAFVSDGVATARPAPADFATRAARAGLALASHRVMPTLAIAPAPKQYGGTPCDPPSLKDWSALDSGG